MNDKTVTLENCGILLKEREINLINELRKIPYGQATVYMQDGVPVRIERIKVSILL